ncbi:MAG: class I adenylate-forming enzyme family protein [Parvibaculales bacterium]
MNIHLILQMAADAMPDRVAVTNGERNMTYAELGEAVRRLATALPEGQRVGYIDENDITAPVALFAAALRGTPYVPMNYRLAADQIDTLLRRITPAMLITDKTYGVDGISLKPHAAVLGETTVWQEEAPDVEGLIAIELFTSGTTGEPKSAILRHDNLMSYILGTVEFMGAEEDEAALLSVPPYHIAGISAVLSATYLGRRMVQLPNFSPEAWLRLASEECITNAFVVPTMLQRIIEHAEENGLPDLGAMRAIAYGGGKMPLSVIEKAMEMMPQVDFTNAYGLTETSSTICLLDPEAHRAAYAATDPLIRARLASVGQPLPTIELEIRGEDGTPCPVETPGDVYVRGEQVSGEYHGAGSMLDEQGWFPTRDRGYLDAEGFLFLDGRADDVIVRGGENISPGEIEDVLITHEGVRDVAVLAIPDEEWGEAVGAVIVPTDAGNPPAEASVCNLVKDRLRSSRVPAKIVFKDELPYNETGKLLRRLLRAEFETVQD